MPPVAEAGWTASAPRYGNDAVRVTNKPMLEIISRDPDRDIIASAAKLAVLGLGNAA
jgi:hypothetical protein